MYKILTFVVSLRTAFWRVICFIPNQTGKNNTRRFTSQKKEIDLTVPCSRHSISILTNDIRRQGA